MVNKTKNAVLSLKTWCCSVNNDMDWQQWNQSASLNSLDELRGFKGAVVTVLSFGFF